MAIDQESLDQLRLRSDAIADQTFQSASALLQRGGVAALREVFAATRFVRLPAIAPAQPLAEALEQFLSMLGPLFQPVVARHQPTAHDGLGYGARFLRLDPGLVVDPETRRKLEAVLDGVGVSALGAALGAALTPLMRGIVGEVSYQRTYLYLYREGDYVGAHDDSHVGQRVDVQFPVTMGGSGGLRVLRDGLFEMHYDAAGTANILGPAMWHEVPPLMRSGGAEPFRLNLGLRFTPDAADEMDAASTGS